MRVTVSNSYERPDMLRLVASTETEPEIGCVEYYVRITGDIEVDQVEVVDEYRRRGVATLLYDAVQTLYPDTPIVRGNLSCFGESFRDAYDARTPRNVMLDVPYEIRERPWT